MEAAAKVVIAADEQVDSNHRAASTFHEERLRERNTRIGHGEPHSARPTSVVHDSEAVPVVAGVDLVLGTQSIPLAQASPVEATNTGFAEGLEQRLDLMTEMLIDMRRESLTGASDSPPSSPQFDIPPPPSPRSTVADNCYRKLCSNIELQPGDFENYVQERLTPVFARRRSSITSYLGSLTPPKKHGTQEVKSPVKPTPLFPRRSFSNQRGSSETKDYPTPLEDTPKNLPQDTVKATVAEVLDSIRTSPQASRTSPVQVTPKEVLEAELDALNSTQPIATAHVVTEQEDPDLVLRNLDAAVASLHQTLEAKVVQLADPVDDENYQSYMLCKHYGKYISCFALGAGIAVSLKALKR